MARRPSPSDNGSTKADTSDATDAPQASTSKTANKTNRKTSRAPRGRGPRRESNAIESSGGTLGAARMIVNYIPGDECRVAFVDENKLEEYHAEPTGSVSRVNNIYLGVVRNVNTAVQAAFIDFGLEEHGFLHTTDVHPRYFPKNEDAAERVGIKTPRRDRPPIQRCFKPGDRIMVQVLKEGVGTKGPTLTSYISIPGRYLVMMPGMDNVGVSRKVEDDDTRREMRKVLDQLELPEGFGFILRTAGMDRNKTELNKDLAYLKRLWADMEKKQKVGKGPLPLYAESDLLLRAMRDLAGSEVTDIIIDDPTAVARAERFLKISAPRNRPRLRHYAGAAPIFAAFGIEQQIQNIHSREVPLPSGGRLIFEETEALVAIDVNSGRSRSAKDAETNALNTNLEAVDEICRQLRLRDMGGLVINDLIDMRHARNRQEVEQRFAERLKRDRAKSTILPISEFGILEMTRQRMRSSHERTHFAECHLCKGRGVLRRPDSVAAEALRELALVASRDKVSRVEMVVSAQVASHLLSGRRKQLSRIERVSGVITEVRVSETMAAERFVLHAYEENGNDINLEKLPKLPDPEQFLVDVEGMAIDEQVETIAPPIDEEEDDVPDVEAHPIELDASYEEDEEAGERGGRRRRRRRRRRGGRGPGEEAAQRDGTAHDEDDHEDDHEDDGEEAQEVAEAPDRDETERHDAEADESDRPRRKRRRRRRRGGRGRTEAGAAQRDHDEDGDEEGDETPDNSLARRLASALATPVYDKRNDEEHDEDEDEPTAEHAEAHDDEVDAEEDDHPRRKRRRRRRRGQRRDDAVTADQSGEEPDDAEEAEDVEPAHVEAEGEQEHDEEEQPRRKRRRRRGRGDRADAVEATNDAEHDDEDGDESPTVEVVGPEPAPAGLIEPRPPRDIDDSEDVEASAPAAKPVKASGSKPRPRFLYAAHRKTRPTGNDGA